MRSLCLCEKNETVTAMRLGGIESIVITSEEEANKQLTKAIEDPQIAIVMITENIHTLIEPFVTKCKLEQRDTLIILVPEPDGLSDKDYIMNTIKNSIGIKL